MNQNELQILLRYIILKHILNHMQIFQVYYRSVEGKVPFECEGLCKIPCRRGIHPVYRCGTGRILAPLTKKILRNASNKSRTKSFYLHHKIIFNYDTGCPSFLLGNTQHFFKEHPV